MRNGLTDGDINALMYLSPVGRWSFQRRIAKGSGTYSTKSDPGAVSFPYWVRMVRAGNTISGYYSLDGNSWILADFDFIPMDNDIYVGLAVTSHDDATMGTATFESVSFGSNAFTFPVEYLDFTATPDPANNRVDLQWVTASEENNSHFTVERSMDGALFQPIGLLHTQGNGTEIREYQMFDNNPLDGVSYYRLKQTDVSGAFSYSDQIMVTFDALSVPFLKVYPNPVHSGDMLQLEFFLPNASMANISLFAADGRQVWHKSGLETTGGQTFEERINTSSLNTGIYFLLVTNPSDLQTKASRRILIRN